MANGRWEWIACWLICASMAQAQTVGWGLAPTAPPTGRSTLQPVSETRWVQQSQTVYQPRVTLQQRETTEIEWRPITSTQWTTYWQPGPTPGSAPTAQMRPVQITRWEATPIRVKVPVQQQTWVPQTRTVSVPVTQTRYVARPGPSVAPNPSLPVAPPNGGNTARVIWPATKGWHAATTR